jgi:hypothetical protein
MLLSLLDQQEEIVARLSRSGSGVIAASLIVSVIVPVLSEKDTQRQQPCRTGQPVNHTCLKNPLLFLSSSADESVWIGNTFSSASRVW